MINAKLDYYYKIVTSVILSKQNPNTGLIPASTAITSHGNYTDSWVRDNVYSIIAVFGLALAYRRIDDDTGRSYELEHAVIKNMRGLLFAMMKQSKKVEAFKNKQSVENALHAKYSTATADTVVGDYEWGHLQLDATSLFVLYLAQMTSSGFHIVYTLDEVDFVQNLVFYIERAYRTQDYSLWERGNKQNNGEPELNSSSIGMVTAALQAINGVNLFGARGGPSSVIHALPDEMTRNYTTLHSALPRESMSKEIDAGTLSAITFPAFAVHDLKLLMRTKNDIVTKLKGKYGMKRFLRDGHQCMLEDTSRLHYNPSELKVFENVESEWPLFYCYMILDGLFIGDTDQVEEYRSLLQPCLINSSDLKREPTFPGAQIQKQVIPNGIPLVPELYIVPLDKIEAEKANPHSQKRIPNENVPLVWAQSLYILGELLYENLLTPAEVDPLGRHLQPAYEAAQSKNIVVQIALIAEDASLQRQLATYGLETQTPDEVAPITIAAPAGLRDAYSVLGANQKLGLTGRPKRPIGTLGTCKLYRVQGRLYAFTPHFMDISEFYLSNDNDYLISIFETELLFVSQNWKSSGRPMMTVVLTHQMMGTMTGQQSLPMQRHQRSILNFMMSLRNGVTSNGVRVRQGRVHELVGTCCIQNLDFLATKIEQGYFAQSSVIETSDSGDTRINWSELLGGLRQRKKWDSKLSLGPELSVHIKDIANSVYDLRKSRSVKRQSSVDAPLSINVLNSNTQALQKLNSPAENARERRISEYKLKDHLEVNTAIRPVSPATLSTRSSVFIHSKSAVGYEEDANAQTCFTLGDPSQLNYAVQTLAKSVNLHDQSDLLNYIQSCRGMKYQVDGLHETVEVLLEEVYDKATHFKIWNVVREVAGLLKKVVNSLTINLTDLLIRQKFVTIGDGENEVSIQTPMTPEKLAEVIFSATNDHDVVFASLIQEVLIYLGSFIRSEPRLFDGILRVRIHQVMKAMLEEVSRIRGCDEELAVELMLQLSPMEMKCLLGFVLSAKDQTDDPTSIDSIVFAIPHLSPSSNGQRYHISVQSSGYYDGNFANISINGHYVVRTGERGINVLILNLEDGSIVRNTHYDTFASVQESNMLAKLLQERGDNLIVVLAIRDEATEQLTDELRRAIQELGSIKIDQVGFRDSWCMIAKVDNKKVELVQEHHQKAISGPTPVIEFTQTNEDHPLFCVNYQSAFDNLKSDSLLPSKGTWLRRRKIDGALQRTPKSFYPKVHKILEKSRSGIKVNDQFLPRNPTVSEKTPEESSFALLVDRTLNGVAEPAEIQLAVECLSVIAEIERRNPQLNMCGNSDLDLILIMQEAYQMFWRDFTIKQAGQHLSVVKSKNNGKVYTPTEQEIEIFIKDYPFKKYEATAKKLFSDLKQDGKDGSVSYLTKASVRVLPLEIDLKIIDKKVDKAVLNSHSVHETPKVEHDNDLAECHQQ